MIALLSALAFHGIGTQNPRSVWMAIEALKEGWRERRFTVDELMDHARICRVANVMRPYLQAVV